MKKILIAIAVMGSMTGATMVATSAPAMAASNFSFSFNTGDVSMAFSDGYYDSQRRWHKWRTSREAREYRTRYGHNWQNRRHRDSDRDGIPNRFDRDRDNDGVPNRFDRDRDNDGVPNRFDSNPNNPRRN